MPDKQVDAVEKTEAGTALVQRAGRSMEDVLAGVDKVSRVIAGISTAASEQSDGLAQVNVAVSELDRVTQQNASLVEQSAQAAESLREQAQRLNEAMGQFKFSR